MKYTQASALAIKRDIERGQKVLTDILNDIETKKEELKTVKAELQQEREFVERKRGLVGKVELAFASVFTARSTSAKEMEKYAASLTEQIRKLEIARDLADKQLQMKKQEVVMPEGAEMVKSLVTELTETLSRLSAQVQMSKEELQNMETKKVELKAATTVLESEKIVQETKVRALMADMNTIETEREAVLRELATEKNKLTEIQNRERASKTLANRLTAEYQKTYQSLPHRGKK